MKITREGLDKAIKIINSRAESQFETALDYENSPEVKKDKERVKEIIKDGKESLSLIEKGENISDDGLNRLNEISEKYKKAHTKITKEMFISHNEQIKTTTKEDLQKAEGELQTINAALEQLRNGFGNKYFLANSKWFNAFDWSVGLYLGYRWDLPKQWFLDWNFLDFSHGVSMTTFRVGRPLTNKLSLYGIFSPCVLMVTDGVLVIHKVIPGKQVTRRLIKDDLAPTLSYRVPFIGLGVHFGIGGSYRISSRVSFVGQWTMQVSYFDAIDKFLDIHQLSRDKSVREEPRTHGEVIERDRVRQEKEIITAFYSKVTAIRQRVSIGVEFHSSDHA